MPLKPKPFKTKNSTDDHLIKVETIPIIEIKASEPQPHKKLLRKEEIERITESTEAKTIK